MGIDFEHKIIDLRNKPKEFIDKYATAMGSTNSYSVSAKVPLLEYGETLVIESVDVARFIASNVCFEGSNQNQDMYPPGEDSTKIDQFIDAFEETIQEYYGFLMAMSESQVDAARVPFRKSLDRLGDCFSDYGDNDGGPYVLGNTFSVTECVAAPWIHRFAVVLPHFRDTKVNDLVSSSKVQRWLDAVLDHPSVQSTNGPIEYVLSSTQSYFVGYFTPGSPSALGDSEVVM